MLVVPVFVVLTFQSKSCHDKVSTFELKYSNIWAAFDICAAQSLFIQGKIAFKIHNVGTSFCVTSHKSRFT